MNDRLTVGLICKALLRHVYWVGPVMAKERAFISRFKLNRTYYAIFPVFGTQLYKNIDDLWVDTLSRVNWYDAPFSKIRSDAKCMTANFNSAELKVQIIHNEVDDVDWFVCELTFC
jgi:hypothetical protein